MPHSPSQRSAAAEDERRVGVELSLAEIRALLIRAGVGHMMLPRSEDIGAYLAAVGRLAQHVPESDYSASGERPG